MHPHPNPPLPRTFIIIAFGPLVGAMVMTTVMLGLALSQNPENFWDHILYGIALFVASGYVAGFLPAIAAAILWRFVPPNWPRHRRAIAAIVIGAITSAALVWPFMSLFLSFMPPNLGFAALSALCGAIALCATALPGAQR